MSDDAPRPQGWLARATPEAQRELAQLTLATLALRGKGLQLAELAPLEVSAADALDGGGFAAAMDALVSHLGEQVGYLQQMQQLYGRMGELAREAG